MNIIRTQAKHTKQWYNIPVDNEKNTTTKYKKNQTDYYGWSKQDFK